MSSATEPRLVQKLEGAPWEIEGYLKVGGYEAWKRCVDGMKADDVVAELKKAGLRGRGGAGFPTGVKWDKVLNHRVKEHYFVCNAGEHEPGTFKDRFLLKTLPHQLIEGCLIAAHTVQAKAAFIYANHEYEEERENLKKAIAQARARGFLGKNVLGKGYDIELQVFDGYGSYVLLLVIGVLASEVWRWLGLLAASLTMAASTLWPRARLAPCSRRWTYQSSIPHSPSFRARSVPQAPKAPGLLRHFSLLRLSSFR